MFSVLLSAALSFGGWAASAEVNHPIWSTVLYTLSAVSFVAAIALAILSRRARTNATREWREQERRFRDMNKAIEGHWNRQPGPRLLHWSIWPSSGATPRDVELFQAEAIHASRLLKKTLGYSDKKFVAWYGPDEVDQWLNAIRPLVDARSSVSSSGRRDGQKLAGHYVDELPIMSAVACVRLAAGTRPRVGLPSNQE